MDKKIVAILAVVIVVVAAVAAGISMNNSGGNDDKREETITDGIGRTVTINSVDKITSASATVTAMLCGLGLSSHIVGVTTDNGVYAEDAKIIGITDDDFPKAIVDGLADGSIKGIGNMYNISAEAVLGPNADIIVFGEYGYSPNTGAELDKIGATYIVLKNEDSLETALNNIILLGKVFGKQTAAEKMVDEMNNVIDKIDAWCKNIVDTKLNGTKRNVALMMTASYAIGPEYIAGTVLERLHVVNVFSELGKYGVVSKEAIAEKNPAAIIYTTLGMGDGVTDASEYIKSLASDPVLGSVDACKNQRVYAVEGGAKNAMSYVDQGFVTAYAMCAMFIYSDYLGFEIPNVLDSSNYSKYVFQFWNMIN